VCGKVNNDDVHIHIADSSRVVLYTNVYRLHGGIVIEGCMDVSA